MSKKNEAPKIGKIVYTDAQKALIAQGVETNFFQFIARILRPKRQTKIAVTALNVAQDDKDLFYYKGQSGELDWFVNELERVARDYQRSQDQEADI